MNYDSSECVISCRCGILDLSQWKSMERLTTTLGSTMVVASLIVRVVSVVHYMLQIPPLTL